MDETWLLVADVAAELHLSDQRVRELLGTGVLSGRKLGGVWFVDPLAVQRRNAQSRHSGRPLSANNAWRLLALLSATGAGEQSNGQLSRALESANAVERSRLRALLADLPDAKGLARRLSARAKVRRMRAHMGVVARLAVDRRVSVGGGRALAAQGGGVAAGGIERIYVHEQQLAEVVGSYRLVDDVEGNIDVAVVAAEVDAALGPEPGRAVPLEVAWVDLLDDPDSRVRNAARVWATTLARGISITQRGRR